MSPHEICAYAAGLAFLTMPAALLYHSLKIWRRGTGPKIEDRLLYAHLRRWQCWALFGSATLVVEPFWGMMFLASRFIGSFAIELVLIQKEIPTPSMRLVVDRLSQKLLPLVILCTVIALLPFRSTVAQIAYVTMWVLFAYSAYATICQITVMKRNGTFGMLKVFQWCYLFNNVVHVLAGLTIPNPLYQLLIVSVYGLATVLQALLVVRMTDGNRRYRLSES